MTPIASDIISAASYEFKTKTLILKFARGGTLYEYPDVPPHIYTNLLDATSPGSYFHAKIKNQYKGKKMETQADD